MDQFSDLQERFINWFVQQLESLLGQLKPSPPPRRAIKHVDKKAISIRNTAEVSRERVAEARERVFVQHPPMMRKHFQEDPKNYKG